MCERETLSVFLHVHWMSRSTSDWYNLLHKACLKKNRRVWNVDHHNGSLKKAEKLCSWWISHSIQLIFQLVRNNVWCLFSNFPFSLPFHRQYQFCNEVRKRALMWVARASCCTCYWEINFLPFVDAKALQFALHQIFFSSRNSQRVWERREFPSAPSLNQEI